jgi:hypothetical protein
VNAYLKGLEINHGDIRPGFVQVAVFVGGEHSCRFRGFCIHRKPGTNNRYFDKWWSIISIMVGTKQLLAVYAAPPRVFETFVPGGVTIKPGEQVTIHIHNTSDKPRRLITSLRLMEYML